MAAVAAEMLCWIQQRTAEGVIRGIKLKSQSACNQADVGSVLENFKWDDKN